MLLLSASTLRHHIHPLHTPIKTRCVRVCGRNAGYEVTCFGLTHINYLLFACHAAATLSKTVELTPPSSAYRRTYVTYTVHLMCYMYSGSCIKVNRPPLWSSGQSSWLQNGDVLCFLWGTNWIYICYVEESRPLLWSSGQSSWLQNGDVLCFLWGTNWIYTCYVEESRPLLWSSGQSYWLQNGDVLCFLWGTNWIYMLCGRK
jgi:hypothetical protein